MEMITWRQGAFFAILLLVVGFFSIPAQCQQPRRRPRDRVIAAQDDIPVTNFSCANRTSGYYADVETGCQVYHMCDGGRQFSYRCPDTTLFQQRMLICAHWYQVNCSRSEQHYSANLLIGQRDKPFVEEADYFNIYFNGKGIKTLKNPDDLQTLNSGNGGAIHSNQVFHNNKVETSEPSSHVNIISTHATPTQTVFTKTNVGFNGQFSNQNFKANVAPTQTIFTKTNPNLNAQFSNQNFKPNVAPTQSVFTNTNSNSGAQFSNQNFKFNVSPTQSVFTNTNSNLNAQFSNQNFKPNAVPTQSVFTSTNPNLDAQFSNQNIKPHGAPTQSVFTDTNPNLNGQFSNQNFKSHFESQSSSQPPVTFQSRTTTFVPLSKQVTSSSTPRTQFEQNIPIQQTFSNQNVDTPIIQTNEYNNFIKRFNPDTITEAIIKDTRNDASYSQYNNFIKRFNPDEVSLENVNVNQGNQSIASFVNSNFYSNGNFETHNLEPPVPPPSSNIELPIDDPDQMESNHIELHFQDPRQAFFIPESDSQIIPAESATPITVNIPRNVGQEFHPMLFVNSVSDTCFRCHPSFVINKAACTPCVVIR